MKSIEKNKFFFVFFAFILILTILFFGSTIKEIYKYYSLDTVLNTSSVDMKIRKESVSKYLLEIQYTYFVDGKLYENSEVLKNKVFLTSLAAQSRIDEIFLDKKKVWFNSSKPKISTLDKKFPIKKTLYSFVLILLSLYFVCLFYYVKKYN